MPLWKKVKLGDVVEIIKDTYQPSDKDDFDYIGLEHIEQQSLRLNSIGKSTNVSSGKFKFKTGDILFGKLRPYFRKVVIPNFPGVCSTDIWVIRTREGFDQKFLFYLLASETFIEMSSSGSTGTRMPRADWSLLRTTEWIFPDLATQSRIASILSAFDDKIELNRQMNNTLEHMVQALFKKYFITEIDPDNLPEGWKWGKLGDVMDLNYGKSLKESERIQGIFPVIGSSGIIGWHNESLVNGPGIVLGRKGNAGAVIWIYKNFFPIDTTFYIIDKIGVSDLFFHHILLQQFDFKNQNADSAVPGLNRNEAYNNDTIIPARDEIERFNMIVKSLYHKIKLNDEETENLTQLRDSLLPKLMNGEIPVDSLSLIESQKTIVA